VNPYKCKREDCNYRVPLEGWLCKRHFVEEKKFSQTAEDKDRAYYYERIGKRKMLGYILGNRTALETGNMQNKKTNKGVWHRVLRKKK
jgi:hypothetical protein